MKGPDETYDIGTIEDMLKFRVNFPYFPPSLVSGTLADKVRNVCLKLLSIRNAQPILDFEGDYLDKDFGESAGTTRSGEKVFGYVTEDRPLNIDFCGFPGRDGAHPLREGDVQLLPARAQRRRLSELRRFVLRLLQRPRRLVVGGIRAASRLAQHPRNQRAVELLDVRQEGADLGRGEGLRGLSHGAEDAARRERE